MYYTISNFYMCLCLCCKQQKYVANVFFTRSLSVKGQVAVAANMKGEATKMGVAIIVNAYVCIYVCS